MATITSRVTGNFRGKLGNTIFSRWKKLYIAKGTGHRKKKKIGTPSLPQVQKVKLMSRFLGNFIKEIRKGFYKKNSKHTPWTLALRYNLEKAIIGDADNYAINYKNIRIADGSLEGAWAAKIYFEPGCTVRITWQISAMSDQTDATKDIAWIALYNETDQHLHHIKTIADRAALTCTYHWPQSLVGHTYHAWIFFISPDGKQVSTSDYIGSGVLIA